MVQRYKLSPNTLVLFKRLIWAYFLLLIFEGALRKWVLPSLANPLLVVRDPLAIVLIFLAIKNQILRANLYLTGIVLIGIISMFTALFLGHGNLYVALFGTRVFVLHFPLIFVIGEIFERKDVEKMGKVLLWIAIPMAILIALQFNSPQSAWVNKGIGEESEGGGFSGAMGFFRPPATFSFATGTTVFFSLVACFVFYFWLNSKSVNKLILIGATLAVIVSIPFSISRTLLFTVILTALFAVIAILKKPEYLGKLALGVFAVVIIVLIFGSSAALQNPIEAFTDRFTTANEVEGGLKGVAGNRFLGGMIEAVVGSSDQPFFGYGIGMGTNVGAMLLRGEKTFLIAEAEWGRVLGEQGPLLGLAIIVLRLLFCFQLALAAYRRLQVSDMLPWMLLNFALLNIAQGQWGQPTSLGFSVLIGGLMLASIKKSIESTKEYSNELVLPASK